MELSEREQQILHDLEQQLNVEDPALASSLAQPARPTLRVSPRRIGTGVALLLMGMAVVLAGVSLGGGISSVLIGVLGFALAVWGVTLMLSAGASSQESVPANSAKSASSQKASKRASFMDKQASRWEERRERRS